MSLLWIISCCYFYRSKIVNYILLCNKQQHLVVWNKNDSFFFYDSIDWSILLVLWAGVPCKVAISWEISWDTLFILWDLSLFVMSHPQGFSICTPLSRQDILGFLITCQLDTKKGPFQRSSPSMQMIVKFLCMYLMIAIDKSKSHSQTQRKHGKDQPKVFVWGPLM